MSLFTLGVLQAVLWVAGLAAIGVVATNWPAALDLRITLRYLRSRRSSRLLSLITVIAVGGVTVGVMALVIVLGVMNGLQADLRDKILVANPHLRVLTYGEGLRLEDWHKVLAEVRRTTGVEAAAPFVLTQGLISAGHDYAEGVVVYGPQFHRYEVTGIFDTGMFEYDNSYVALDRKAAQRFAGLDTAVTGIEVRLADPEQAQPFGIALETRLGYPYRALDWQSQNASLF